MCENGFFGRESHAGFYHDALHTYIHTYSLALTHINEKRGIHTVVTL